ARYPRTIGQLRRQRPVVDKLEGNPCGVQAPIECVEPRMGDRSFWPGGDNKFRPQDGGDGVDFNRALFAEDAGKFAHSAPSLWSGDSGRPTDDSYFALTLHSLADRQPEHRRSGPVRADLLASDEPCPAS